MTEPLYSSAEVAAAAGLSRVRVNAIAQQHGFGCKAGSRRVFTQADIEVLRDRKSWWGQQPEVPPAPILYSIAEVAGRLHVSAGTVDRLARDRGLGRCIGEGRVFTPEEVELLRSAPTRRRGQLPPQNTFYSVAAAAFRLGTTREAVGELAERLDLGRRKGQVTGRRFSEVDLDQLGEALTRTSTN